MEKTKKILAYLSISSLLLPWVVKAQISGGTIPQVNLPLLGGGTFRGTVVYVINILIAIAGIIAVLFLIYGGLQYITSGGNEEVAESAKKTIQNSIIGLVIIILSFTIITVIANALVFNRT
ncbi:MAG TPA: hypothetical protein VF974_01930 [Patescibacteria group bacterium]